nr:MAG TPA: hypothetical protein [Bacteriophage sp.]
MATLIVLYYKLHHLTANHSIAVHIHLLYMDFLY